MDLPKIDINSLMSSLEKQNNIYDEILTSLNHIEIILSQMFHLQFSEEEDYKLTQLICEFDNLSDTSLTYEQLCKEVGLKKEELL